MKPKAIIHAGTVPRFSSDILNRGALGLAMTLGIAAAGCSSSDAPTVPSPVGMATSAVVGGRPSGEDENANIYMEAGYEDAGNLKRCSGRLVAPNLVLTARHCLLNVSLASLHELYCNQDGTVQDPTSGKAVTATTLMSPSDVRVYVGANRTTAPSFGVRQLVAEFNFGVCDSDMVFLVLDQNALDVHATFRKTRVAVGDTFSVSGWGLTGDNSPALPTTRTTVDGLAVINVGPGLVPADAFAANGGHLCFGDSGAAAMSGNVNLGVFSRIQGQSCETPQYWNLFTMVADHLPLLEEAFAAVGSRPWYEGEPPPWLSAAGSPCTSGTACQSGLCDTAAGVCAEACGDGGACSAGQQCSAAGACVASSSSSSSSKGCAVVTGSDDGSSVFVALVGAGLVALGSHARRRRGSGASR